MSPPRDDAHLDTIPIGTRNESTLHRDLKGLVAEPGDRFEVSLRGFEVDIVRGDTCIEIQTSRLAALERKVAALATDHHVHIVHPIAVDTWIHRSDRPPRKSPKHATIHDVFAELVGIPCLLQDPNVTLEVFLVQVDAVKVHDPNLRRRRGGWRTVDRRLRSVVGRHGFRTIGDLMALLPDGLPEIWTTRDVADGAGVGRDVAQQVAYVLRHCGEAVEVGRDRAGVRYRLCRPTP